MDLNDIRTLKILEEIDSDSTPSQRDLAGKLNVSLGLVNSFIKRLVHKGYFKVATIPRNRIKYILTPKGVAEKTRLTYQFVQYSFQFYKKSRKKLRDLFNELSAIGVQQIIFYGVSDFAEIAYISLQETNIQLTAVIDVATEGKKFFNLIAENPYKLNSIKYDRILITDIQHREKILDDILSKGISREKIAALE